MTLKNALARWHIGAQLNAAEAELAAIKATYDSTVKLVERGLATELALSNQRCR